MRNVTLVVALGCASLACQAKPIAAKQSQTPTSAAKAQAAAPAKQPVAKPRTVKPSPPATKPKTDSKATKAPSLSRRALLQYEQVRKALAADDFKAAKSAAMGFEFCKDAATQPLQAAAKALPVSEDIAAARLAFGPLAKAALTLAVADKQASKGALAWQCPMAKGYQKWLQLDPDMANPYMGKRMLKCGGRVPLSP